MSHDIDEDFLRECLNEVRDGEWVTIRTHATEDEVYEALRRLGATDDDLENIFVEEL